MHTTIRKVTKVWTCKDGTRLRICDMTDSHLNNAIKFLERKASELRIEMPYPSFQGEMAQFYAEREYDAFQESSNDEIAQQICPLYDSLVEAQYRRTTK